VRNKALTTVGQKVLNADCPAVKGGKISCRGKLCDTVLDWEHLLPEKDLALATLHSKYVFTCLFIILATIFVLKNSRSS